ncbi:MAG TPA: TonB-dependent receptor [Gemmatimonadaceae bacterium]
MRRSILAALGLLTLAGTTALQAQAATGAGPRPAGAQPAPAAGAGELRGTVSEAESGAPVPRASVAVRNKAGALVTGAIANDKGAFVIPDLRPGTYTARVTSLGFSPRVQEFTVTDAAPRVALGAVKMTRVAVALAGVAVTAERDAMVVEPDRNSYRAKDVAPAAQNASDVLDNTPSVQVDGEGKVSLRGNENVAVQINGRPAPIRGAQLGAYLKGLPASVVERVEVIPNPSAKYDPEGMAGIINIVLKSTVDLGLSGGATVAAANGDRYNGSGNVGYQAGPWTSFLNVGVNNDGRDILGANNRERYVGGSPAAFTDQALDGWNSFAGKNLNANLEYKLNARDALNATTTFAHRKSGDVSYSGVQEFDAGRSLLDQYGRSRDSWSTGMVADGSVGFRRTFDPKVKHELTSEVRYTRNHDDDNSRLWRLPAAASSATRREGEVDVTDAVQDQVVAQVDYTKGTAKRLKVESGYKGTARFLDRDFAVEKDSLGNGQWVRSPLSNAFQFDEQVHAAYGVVSKGVGKWELQGGLRAEYASRDFSLAAAGGNYPYRYTSLFPSAVATFAPSEASQYKASYSRRIRRPGTQELNPFPTFFDVQNVFIGNPNLSPEYTDALELGYTRNGALGTLQLAPFYRRTTNVIRIDINTADTVDGRDVTTVSFRNLATSNSWGADVNGSLRLGKKFSTFAGFNVFKMVTDGGSQSSLSSDAVSWMGRVNATLNATPTTMFQGSYFYRAPMKIERGQFSSTQMANFSVRQKIRGDANSVTLRVVDPFNTQRFLIKAGDDNLVQLTSRTFGVRAVFLSYQYTFGRPPRIRVRQDEPQQQGPGFP